MDEEFNTLAEQLALGVHALQSGAAGGVRTILEAANAQITVMLARQPSDYQTWRLTALQESIRQELDRAYAAVAEDAGARQFAAWQQGAAVVDVPLQAAGVGVRLNAIDSQLILAMGEFQTGLIRNTSADVIGRVNARLAGVVAGMETPFAAMQSISRTLEGGHGMRRAERIVITEVGRAFSAATQARMAQAVEEGIPLQKKWRRSGKIYSRVSHDIVDGQKRDVDEPFVIEGERILYPRAPGTSAKNSVNCGCVIVPVVEGLEESQPGRRPFSEEEQRLNATKRDLEKELSRAAPLDFAALDNAPEVAKGVIAEALSSKGFADHVRKARQGSPSYPVAVLSQEMAQALGSESRIVRFSGATAEKQRRKHPDVTVEDYGRIGDVLGGVETKQSANKSRYDLRGFEGKNWRTVLKTTQDGREIYMLTLFKPRK